MQLILSPLVSIWASLWSYRHGFDETMKRFFSFLLIFVMTFPPMLVVFPRESDALLPLIARALMAMSSKAGFSKTSGLTSKGIQVPFSPYRGKLYELRGSPWSGAFKASAASHAAVLGALLYYDQPFRPCASISVAPQYHKKKTYLKTPMSSALEQFNEACYSIVDDPLDEWICNYSQGAPYPVTSGVTYSSISYKLAGQTTYVGTRLGTQPPKTGGSVTCNLGAEVIKSAYERFVEVEILTRSDEPYYQTNVAEQFLQKSKDFVASSPLNTPSDQNGLDIVEVERLVFADENGVEHTYSKNPVTGNLMLDGVEVGDTAQVQDVNEQTHDFSVDPYTSQVLDNGAPVGDFAEWVDSSGVTHVVSVDPLTGRLLMDDEIWNPNYTASDPSAGQDVTTPVADTPPIVDTYTVADTPPVVDTYTVADTPPIIDTYTVADTPPIVDTYTVADTPPIVDTYTSDLQLQEIIDQLRQRNLDSDAQSKALSKSMDSLSDAIAKEAADKAAQEAADKAVVTTQLDAIRAKEAGNKFMGISDFTSRVQKSAFYSSMEGALVFQGLSGYPRWEMHHSLSIVGEPMSIDVVLDTANYPGFFQSCSYVIMFLSSWFAFRRIFG